MAFCKHRVMDKCKKDGKPCIFSDECFEPEEQKPMTNGDRIRAMTDEELAAHTVQDSVEYTVDYDWDEEPIGEYTPCFKTSDGSIFWSYEEAVEYETQWLKQPAKEGE